MITGTKDVVCDAGHARRVMEKSVVENGMLRVVDFEAGHWIMMERREEFNKVLREWLGETDGGKEARARL
jgi:soluble epoxide hydrolase/lipid-phosphate phosphatase